MVEEVVAGEIMMPGYQNFNCQSMLVYKKKLKCLRLCACS